jgi:hypothetical protein
LTQVLLLRNFITVKFSIMRNSISVNDFSVINRKINTFYNLKNTSINVIENTSASEILTDEGFENFAHYLEFLGLGNDPNLLVLSSLHHYYYDIEEMKNVKTVVNQKELNQIKHIKSFINSIFHILPTNCYFIGCFIDSKKQNGFILRKKSSVSHSSKDSGDIIYSLVSRIPFLNMLFSMIDPKTNKYISKIYTTLLLEDIGFKVLDMTELNGLTYFCARRLHIADK